MINQLIIDQVTHSIKKIWELSHHAKITLRVKPRQKFSEHLVRPVNFGFVKHVILRNIFDVLPPEVVMWHCK